MGEFKKPTKTTIYRIMYKEKYCIRCQNQIQSCLDILLFKLDRNAQLGKLSQGRQTIFGVAGKSGDGLDQDPVDLPSSAVCHHPLKLRALLDPGAGQSLISVDVYQLPAVLLADVLCVAANLRRVGVQLIR